MNEIEKYEFEFDGFLSEILCDRCKNMSGCPGECCEAYRLLDKIF